MKIKVKAFGIAKDIIKGDEQTFELMDGSSIGNLRSALSNQFPEFTTLKSLAFAINEEYATDRMIIKQGDLVIIIPPVSGG